MNEDEDHKMRVTLNELERQMALHYLQNLQEWISDSLHIKKMNTLNKQEMSILH